MILILGAGESGIGAALLAKKYSIPAFVSDYNAIRPSFLSELIANEIDFEEGSHTLAYDVAASLVIKSPGIPDQAEIVNYFKSKNTPVISEIEFACKYCKSTIIAITGSNGKTTTTNLIYHMLKESNKDVVKAGNVGLSFSRALVQKEWKYIVLELSSFQLDGIETFRPYAAVLLNITPDHLDRYQHRFDLYIASKFRIVMNQTKEDYLIYYERDQAISKYLQTNEIRSTKIAVNPELDEKDQIHLDGKIIADLSHSHIKGRHNAINTSCAIQAVKLLGLTNEEIQLAINNFINDPHRLETVSTIDGVEFINDSKATNVDSVFWALDAMKKNVVWIAGGQDKGNDYTVLRPLVEKKVKALVCMGVDNKKLRQAYENIIPDIRDTHSISDAVKVAFQIAESGDVVLLSPACASFDLFANYEDRGTQFKNEVRKLILNTV